MAKFGAAHGVRGEIRLWPFTDDPFAVREYGPLESEDGRRRFEITALRSQKAHLVACIKGIDSREAAEALNGVELYIARDKLPATDADEFYHADLIGLAAETEDGTPLGRIIAVHNFGAGDIIEIRPENGGETKLLPFSNAVVPTVDLANGRAVIVPPTEVEADDRDSADL